MGLPIIYGMRFIKSLNDRSILTTDSKSFQLIYSKTQFYPNPAISVEECNNKRTNESFGYPVIYGKTKTTNRYLFLKKCFL